MKWFIITLEFRITGQTYFLYPVGIYNILQRELFLESDNSVLIDVLIFKIVQHHFSVSWYIVLML